MTYRYEILPPTFVLGGEVMPAKNWRKSGKVTRGTELSRLKEKRLDSRWHKLLLEYYDLAEELKLRQDVNFINGLSIAALTEIIELLKEKKDENV